MKFFLSLVIYFVVWMAFFQTKVFNQNDSLWNIYTTISIVKEGNLDLDEYKELFPKAFNANLTQSNGHFYNYYPYGPSILAIPYIWVIDKWYSLKGKNLQEKAITSSTIGFEKNISSSLLAISASILFLLSLHLTKSIPKSMLVTFLFSFCTIVFSTISRGLWQHTGSILLLSIVLYLFSLKKSVYLILSAIPLYFSYVVRPTNLLPIFFLSLVVIYLLRKNSIYFLGLGFLILISFFYINQIVFGSITHPYYDFRKVSGSDTFYEALLGNLVSPARGLFVYSPIFLFCIYGIYLKRKLETLDLLDYAFFSIIILHWILVSRNLNWWGGHSYGYRLLSDLIPFLIYYLIYFIKYLNFKSIIGGLFIVCALISFGINFRGAVSMETYFWNLKPNNIDSHQKRVWDWNDLPFMR